MSKELTDNAETECLKLKKAINENHRLAQTAAAEAVERGVLTGELLARWKELLPHGRFEGFVEAHFDGSLRTAQLYMQATKRLSTLSKAQRIALLKQEKSIAGLISDTSRKGAAPAGVTYDQEPDSTGDRAGGPDHGAETQHQAGDSRDAHPSARPSKCPNCGGTVWDHDDEGWACSECHEPHGEPAGDVDGDQVDTEGGRGQRATEDAQEPIATIRIFAEGWVKAFDRFWNLCPGAIKLVIRDRIQAPPNSSEFVFALKGDKTWSLPAGKQDEYCTAYPAIDVKAQLRAAVQWCTDNPSRRKSARGMPRFLNGWLGAVAEKGKGGGGNKNWLKEYLNRDKSKDST